MTALNYHELFGQPSVYEGLEPSAQELQQLYQDLHYVGLWYDALDEARIEKRCFNRWLPPQHVPQHSVF